MVVRGYVVIKWVGERMFENFVDIFGGIVSIKVGFFCVWIYWFLVIMML